MAAPWLNRRGVADADLRLTRRDLVALAGVALGGLYGFGVQRARAQTPSTPIRRYVSRPDLNPPAITITRAASGLDRGAIFLAPFEISAAGQNRPAIPASESRSGPLVVDETGEPIWFLPLGSATAMDFRVQTYRGRSVLTWYEGTVLGPYGGQFVIFDPRYRRIARVSAGRGRHGDLHEFLLTAKGTALITIYYEIPADLTSIGGPVDGRLVTGIVQEIDVASGDVIFEWRSREHVPLDESNMTGVTPAGNVDYFHLNSIAIDRDGHLLLSARHTSAVYKIDRRTGKVIWRLGGTNSDFTFGAGASFGFQHDARRQPDGTITLFDNAAALPGPGVASRAIRLALDMKRKRATLVREYKPSDPRSGWAMGNAQQLPDGGLFVGWGTDGSFTEFGPRGGVRLDGRFAEGDVSYRAFRMPWASRPTGRPAAAVLSNDDGTLTVYVSWNGATEVVRWRVEAGNLADRLTPVATRRRTGFETAIALPATSGYLSVVALDVSGKRLAASELLRV
jgi:hypothetical protein